ncbi:hypothetical chaperone protein [Roseovarius marisflavi]|uniref:Hypothetical chaperone protein n=1 Tax=Roseovarius marisflavi TaxID=1054996 RepID=A0A1M6ZH35_9RHOB|nr:Hsp70 family protein [Roseovarius marisflavi]SHL29792.1 hypothetical chaperone protein [Roseovarius marisflavi]
MAQISPVLGLDFGTSNSAAAYLRDGDPVLVAMDGGHTTLPTTFFFEFDTRKTLIGDAANQALLDGIEGRFMRALKRVLGTPLMHETRQILKERVTFVEIIARFLSHIKTRAEAQAGVTFERVLSGRPVVFYGANDPREAQAEADLRACYLAAGFKEVGFLPEPEAAALANGAAIQPGETGLIVDIGGGTSDFSVFRATPAGVSVLASHGVRIGGTDFDRAISIERVMPLLGKGSELRKVMGPGRSPVPNAIFNDLATWEKIPFLYTPQTRRKVDEMLRLANEPEKLARLATLLEHELGHEVAFAVERGKIAANAGDEGAAIALDEIERGLSAILPPQILAACLWPQARMLHEGVRDTLQMAGVDAAAIDHVIYVGGSSLMAMVAQAARAECPDAHHSFSKVFTAVTDGLAIAAARG